jgi:predicted ATPase
MANAGPHGPPAFIAGFRVLGTLGQGGSGVVYLAQDPGLERRIALKVLAPAFAANPERVDRLRREARLLASLNHPHIAAIYGLVEAPGEPLALVLELVDGGTLAARLARGPLGLEESLVLARQVAAALEAAHEQGVIHRDLKPANVMLTAKGAVKLVDFGLARSGPAASSLGEPTRSLTLEAPGAIFGTPGYMSPEQARGLPLDPRTDIFAFGSILFECLAGRPAFAGANLLDVLARTLEGEPDWGTLPSGLPETLRALLAGCLARGAEARLADMSAVVRALAAVAEGGADAAWPAALQCLPAPLTRFIGRARELAELKRLLSFARCVTITGPGGGGKTRVALELARTLAPGYPDGVWLTEFALIREPERVPDALMASLGLREESGRPPEATLADHLREKACLLVLDNCEHLLDACAALARALLAGCPRLRILATSRERFALAGEQDYPLPSLAIPAGEDPDRLAQSEALRLFADRARLVRPDWELDAASIPAVARICRRLDGIPLAIELAAARVRVLPVEAIEARLDKRFRLLTIGIRPGAAGLDPLPHHQTLRATLDWSYALLTGEEQRLLRGLAVFAGGWTLELATAVCGEGRDEFELLELLTHFIDKSLVTLGQAPRGEARYRFLETVREYGLDALEGAGEGAALRDAYLDAYLRLGEEASPHLKSSQQLRWLRRLAAEHENLLAALAWSETAADGAEKGLRLAAAIWPFWENRNHFTLGRGLLARAIERARPLGPSPMLARALTGAGNLAWAQSDYVEAKARHAESLAVYRKLEDPRGIAVGLGSLGLVALDSQTLPEAEALFTEALERFRDLGDRLGTCRTLANLAIILRSEGKPEEARRLQLENLAIRRELGDQRGVGIAHYNLAVIELELKRLDAVRGHVAEALRGFSELEDRLHQAITLERASELAAALGERERAAGLRAVAGGLRAAVGSPVPPKARDELDSFLATMRAALGEAAFARAWAAGEAVPFPEAVAEALDWLEAGGLGA